MNHYTVTTGSAAKLPLAAAIVMLIFSGCAGATPSPTLTPTSTAVIETLDINP